MNVEYRYYINYSGIIQSLLKGKEFMPITKPLSKFMNGFEVIEDLGRAENDIRYARVLCKECKKEFTTSVYHINKIKSCGCLPISIAKELPSIINGFKILKDFGYNNGNRRALAVCKVCIKEYEVDPNQLRYRKHCGCMKKGSIVCRYAKSHPRLTQTYKHMKSRCYNPKNQDYYNYGARGIILCEEWKIDRNLFCEWALKNGYEDHLTIDRINSGGNYEPNNCRFTDSKIQARNTRRNVLTMELAQEIRKEYPKFTMDELAIKYNVSQATIWCVINNKTWVP